MKWLKHLLWKTVTQDPQYEEVQVPCPEITLEEISPEIYAKLLAQATEAGAEFSGSKATLHGAKFDWNYDAETQTLHVTCLEKPFYIGCGVIEQTIHDLVDKAKGGI